MWLGNASWGFRETSLEKQLEITADMGLDLLEIGIANAENDVQLDVTDIELKNIRNLYEKYNVKLLCAATGNDFTNGSDTDIAKIKRVTDICGKLGAKYLRIFAGFSPVDDVRGERWDVMTNSLNIVYDYADEKDIVLTVETHGGVNICDNGVEHFYSTSSKPEALQRMISDVPKIRINFDPANLYAVGIKNPESVYETIKDKVSCIHLKDFIRLPSGCLLPSACGDGDMDWEPLIKSISGFDGPVLFEYENTEDVQEGSLRCYKFLLNMKEKCK